MGQAAKPSREEKAAHERRIFVEFCATSGLTPLSITQPDPPDIIAELDGHGRVAFELVRLNHASEILSMNLMVESTHFLAEQFAHLPAPLHTRLSSMYADAHVLLQFSPAANPGQRKQALPFVWTLLESSAAGRRIYLLFGLHRPKWSARAIILQIERLFIAAAWAESTGTQRRRLLRSAAIPVVLNALVPRMFAIVSMVIAVIVAFPRHDHARRCKRNQSYRDRTSDKTLCFRHKRSQLE